MELRFTEMSGAVYHLSRHAASLYGQVRLVMTIKWQRQAIPFQEDDGGEGSSGSFLGGAGGCRS